MLSEERIGRAVCRRFNCTLCGGAEGLKTQNPTQSDWGQFPRCKLGIGPRFIPKLGPRKDLRALLVPFSVTGMCDKGHGQPSFAYSAQADMNVLQRESKGKLGSIGEIEWCQTSEGFTDHLREPPINLPDFTHHRQTPGALTTPARCLGHLWAHHGGDYQRQDGRRQLLSLLGLRPPRPA